MDDEVKWKVVHKVEKKKKKPVEEPKPKPSKKKKSSSSSFSTTKTKKKKGPKQPQTKKEIALPGDVTEGVYIPPEKLKKLQQEKRELELKKQQQEMRMKNKQLLRKKLQESQKETMFSLDELKEQWDLEDYRDHLEQFETEFESNYEARLQKLGDYLISIFKNCDTKITFDEYDKPYHLIDNEYLEETYKYLEDIPSEDAVTFYWLLVNFIVDSTKNPSKVATMLLIQIISNQYAEEILNNYDEHIEKYMSPKKKKNFKEEKDVPAIMWCTFQTRKSSAGITMVWGKYFLPILATSNNSNLKHLVVRFVEQLVSFPSYTSSADYSVNPPNYKVLSNTLEGVMLSLVSGVISEELTSRLNNIYLQLRSVIFDNEALKKSNYFEMLLNHAASKYQVFRNEALICLHTCLINDENCFDKWRNLYPNHLAQSNNLLVYLRNKWNMPKIKISDENLFSLLNHFMDINKKIDYGEWDFHPPISEEEQKKMKLIALGNNQSIIKLKKVMSTGRLLLIVLVVFLLLIAVSVYFYFNPLQN